MKIEVKGVTIEIDGELEDLNIDYEKGVVKIKPKTIIYCNYPTTYFPLPQPYNPGITQPSYPPFTPYCGDPPGWPNTGLICECNTYNPYDNCSCRFV